MSDIVKRLRDTADVGVPDFTHSGFMREAADTIEALRAHTNGVFDLILENAKLREALNNLYAAAYSVPRPEECPLSDALRAARAAMGETE